MYRMLAPLFRRFPPTRVAYERCKHVYYRCRQPDMIATFEDALADIPDAFVVQVGANDGAQGDPIHGLFERHPGWSGLLIEPVPFVFERLRENYHNDSRFIYARVAIADEQGSFPFYHVSPAAHAALGVSEWADAVSSFDREHIVRCDPRLEPYIVEEAIPCVRLDALLNRYGIDCVDAVCIDTEGHDARVLAQLDLPRFRPKAVLYEHKHLSAQDRARARDRLTDAGYRTRRYDYDTLAIRPS